MTKWLGIQIHLSIFFFFFFSFLAELIEEFLRVCLEKSELMTINNASGTIDECKAGIYVSLFVI